MFEEWDYLNTEDKLELLKQQILSQNGFNEDHPDYEYVDKAVQHLADKLANLEKQLAYFREKLHYLDTVIYNMQHSTAEYPRR